MKKITFILLTLTVAAVVWFAQPSAASPEPTPLPTPQTCFVDAMDTQELLTLTNNERLKAGVRPLTLSPQLTEAARLKAQDMTVKHYWSHDSPEGVEPWYWFKQAGYRYRWAAENLAENYKTPGGVMRGWLESEGHRKNLLSASYSEVGMAVECGVTNKQTTLVVAEYGSR